MTLSIFTLAILTALIIYFTQSLADKEVKKLILFWLLIGIIISIVKSMLVQMTPQWSDVPVDSLTYQLHAKALFLHWSGYPVDASEYKLAGYLNGWQSKYGPYWLPEPKISYAGVLGTREWFYAAFMAILNIAGDAKYGILANAVMAGALPAASYLITRELGGSKRICHLAALFIAVDPSTAINSAWLIKDTLAALISAITIIAICKICKKPSFKFTLILAISLGLLSGVRYVAFIAFGVVIAGLLIFLLIKKSKWRTICFSAASLTSVFIWGLLYIVPAINLPNQNLILFITSPLQAQATTLKAKERETGSDESVIEWRTYLSEHPVKATVRSIARTLFAPYPWTIFQSKLSGNNHIELYLFGTFFWIIVALPGMFIGMSTAIKIGLPAYVLIALLITLTIPYLIFFGEWSTRQRVFMMPLFFSFAAIGWQQIWYSLPHQKPKLPASLFRPIIKNHHNQK
jgi:4-amino-4-deoxy-L-arabinose transferase-like glycosyltransferase